MLNRSSSIVRQVLGGALAGATLLAANVAAQTQVITVPWRGDPAQQHQVYNGGTLWLQGTAIPAAGCSLVSATWDPGDGSAPIAVSVANPRVLETSHVYNGVNNQPYTATLTVVDTCGNTVVDNYRVVVLNRNLDVDVNMAIDRSLWYLHKSQVLSSVGGIPTGYWTSNCTAAATGSAVQALEIHGHRANGNAAEDPYTEDVARGLAHLMTELNVVAIGPQTAGDPDTLPNGIGLQASNCGYPIYVGGQVIDAIVASATPLALATTGNASVLGRTYHDIVQDMIDAYAWGQSDPNWGSARGGWRYGWNGDSDNSAAQWMAIGGIAAERNFGTVIPQWVKDENLNYWLAYSQYRDGTFSGWDGHFGYGGPFSNVDIQCMNTTPSGVVQLDMCDVPSGDPRFNAAQAYMARYFTLLTSNARIYGMFATAKAMRFAAPAPVHTLQSGALSFDWYRAEIAQGAPVDGLARYLCNAQNADGSWYDGWTGTGHLASAWGAIILSSTIVSVGPVAICDAEPDTTAATFPIVFSGVYSYHPDPLRNIINYEWDFDSDGTYDATGLTVIHSFPATGNYTVTLRVTDDTLPVALQSTSTCLVHITPPPFPPNSNPGGPYQFCPAYQPWILDGTGSTDPDGTVDLYEWDFQPQPLDLDFNDAFGSTADVTAYFLSLGPGTYDVALRVTDNNGGTNTDFTTVTVLGPNDPCTGAPPVLNCPPDFTDVWAGGIPAGQALPANTGTATYTDNCALGVQLSYQDISIVPNTPQTPQAPEVVITRRWTLTDGCGYSLSCDQIITLTTPGFLMGQLMLDPDPNRCPNEVWPTMANFRFTIPSTWAHPATTIDPYSIRIHRADGIGKTLRLGAYVTGPSYADYTRPYYGQNGPCDALGPDGNPDLTLSVPSRALRSLFKLNREADKTKLTVVVSGQFITGESFSLTDWIVVRQ